MVFGIVRQSTPIGKGKQSKKQGKTQHARYRTQCTQQATSKASPALRQGKPKTMGKASP
jgi:hypothetical protein